MSDSSSFYRTSYKISSFQKGANFARKMSHQKTQDSDAYFERTASQLAKTKYANITSRSGFSSALATHRQETSSQRRESYLPIHEPTSGRAYGKRKIDPFFLSPGNHGSQFVEHSEPSFKESGPYKLGSRQFSHSELRHRPSAFATMSTERRNTEQIKMPLAVTLTKMPQEADSPPPQTVPNLGTARKRSDFFVKRMDSRNSRSRDGLSQQ